MSQFHVVEVYKNIKKTSLKKEQSIKNNKSFILQEFFYKQKKKLSAIIIFTSLELCFKEFYFSHIFQNFAKKLECFLALAECQTTWEKFCLQFFFSKIIFEILAGVGEEIIFLLSTHSSNVQKYLKIFLKDYVCINTNKSHFFTDLFQEFVQKLISLID